MMVLGDRFRVPSTGFVFTQRHRIAKLAALLTRTGCFLPALH
jgi:hypothetical protein